MNLANRWLISGALSVSLISGAVLWEGTRYSPYEDIVKVVTVCHGYTGKDIVKNKVYTPQECKALLDKELRVHAEGVLKCVNVPLKQHQFDAFVLFAYNVGVNAFCTSNTVLKPLNTGNYELACNGMLKWTYAGGKYVQGLYNRRVYERNMCLGLMSNAKVSISDRDWDYIEWLSVRDPYSESGISSQPSNLRYHIGFEQGIPVQTR